MFHVERGRWHRLLVACLVVAIIVSGWQSPGGAVAALPRLQTGARYAAGVVLVEPKAGLDRQAIARLAGASVEAVLPTIGVVKLRVPAGQEQVLAERIQRSGFVEFASPDYLRSIAVVPNDEDYYLQWALPRIDAPTAWQTSLGDSSVTVAIIDTGYDFAHPDRPVHLIAGPTFTSYASQDNCRPAGASQPQDDNGHGTHVGGIVGAAFNNGIGVAGLAPNVSVLVIKAADCAGQLADSDVAQALHYAADTGAKVINMSFGGPDRDPILDDAVQYATSKGSVLVAAAGNQASADPFYPAWLPGVMAVSATDPSDSFASSFSSYGPDIAVAAPGVSIVSTIPGSYGYKSGTSMAAPHVSAVAALVRSVAPGLDRAEVVKAIEKGAVAKGTGCPNVYFGYGRVDAAGALEAAATIVATNRSTTRGVSYRVFLPLVVGQSCGW